MSLSPTTFHSFHSSISLSTSMTPSTWFLDSGASIHMTSMEQNIHDSQTYVGCEKITTANEHHLSILCIGSLGLSIPQNKSFYLSNFYFVRQLSANLSFVGRLIDNGCLVTFSSFGCVIQERQTWTVIRMGNKHGLLFLVDMVSTSFFASSLDALNNMWTSWHRCHCHLNNSKLMSLFHHGCLESSSNNTTIFRFTKFKCETCCLSKSIVLPFPIHYLHAKAPFDVIHIDVNSKTPLEPCILTHGENTRLLNYPHICLIKASFTKNLVLTHHNKMGWLRERIAAF